MASPNDSAGQPSQPITFTSKAADRIASAVRKVEQGRRDQVGFTPTRAGLLGTKVFRICTYTGAWNIGASKQLTIKGKADTPNTVMATNLFLPLPDNGQRDCAIARDGAGWYLLQVQWNGQAFVSSASLGTENLTFTRHAGVSLGTASTVAITTITCA